MQTYELTKVCDALKPVKFEDSDVIIKTGDKADKMYIVEDGEVKVIRTVSYPKRLRMALYLSATPLSDVICMRLSSLKPINHL